MVELLLLGLALLLVLANAFFVASEFAIVKVRPTRLEQLAAGGSRSARLSLRITRKLDAYLSANQLGITLASLGLGWIGEPAVAALLHPLIAWLGAGAAAASHAISLTISFIAITALHTIVGELAPKSLAIRHTERVALATAGPLHVFYLVMWPVIWVLNAGANAFLRLFGLRTAKADEQAHSSEELRILVARAGAGLDRELRSMLVRVIDLRRRTLRHVMTLRSDVAVLRADQTIAQATDAALEAGYSRYPVLDDAGPAVIGYVHLRDLFEVNAGRREAVRVRELVRAPLFAVDETSVERLRRRMQSLQTPVAIVTSKKGDMVGLITIEDLVEEIVGEIRDEQDEEELLPIQRLGKGVLEVDGRLLIADLEREAHVTLEPSISGVETVGGYVLARLRGAPHRGDQVACASSQLVAVDVAGRRVRRVRIAPLELIAPVTAR